MKKIFLVFALFTVFLSACGSEKPALWGAYQTPTPQSVHVKNAQAAPLENIPVTTAPEDAVIVVTVTPQTAAQQALSAAAITTSQPTLPAKTGEPTLLYYSQSGDTLDVIAIHFGVDVDEIIIPDGVEVPESNQILAPETLLVIPDVLEDTTPNEKIMPDSEIVFSATGVDFDPIEYVNSAGGYLSEYREFLGSTGWTTGAEGVVRLAEENSINPRLLLAMIEQESGWLLGQPTNLAKTDYPLGYINFLYQGMFRQLMLAIDDISVGYYGWRSGTLTELTFPDGTVKRIAPELNAGSVAIQYYFSKKMNYDRWAQMIDPRVGFPALYTELFGDPWARARTVEPLLPAGLKQPPLALPFEPHREWAYTGGPHGAWSKAGSQAALDFAPANDYSGCAATEKWVVASTAGLVVRSGRGVVMLDLDGDGKEQTGWNLLYLHIATEGRIPLGTWVEMDDRLGQPSCEGGASTGTHLHFVRKYNGEWIAADGPIPFNLDGWIAHADDTKAYAGTLTRGDDLIIASLVGEKKSQIFRDDPEAAEATPTATPDDLAE